MLLLSILVVVFDSLEDVCEGIELGDLEVKLVQNLLQGLLSVHL